MEIIENVELLKPGTYQTGGGPVTITPEDVHDIADAYASGESWLPTIRLGHYDRRFDGDPALGTVEDLRVEDGVLKGSLKVVSKAVGDMLRRAYPNRSPELRRNVSLAGRTFKAAMTGLAMLGSTPPAQPGLARLSGNLGEPVMQLSLSEGDTVDMLSDDSPSNKKEGRMGSKTKTAEEMLAEMRAALGIGEEDDPAQAIAALKAKPTTPVVAPTAETKEMAAAGVTLSQEQFDTIMGRLRQVDVLTAEASKRRHADLVGEAVRDGRIPLMSRDLYLSLMETAEEAVVTNLSSLPKGKFVTGAGELGAQFGAEHHLSGEAPVDEAAVKKTIEAMFEGLVPDLAEGGW